MTDLPTLPKAAYSLDLSDGHPVVAYSVQQMYDFARAALAREQEAQPFPQKEFDALLDHIYEHGTTAEGVKSLAQRMIEAAQPAAQEPVKPEFAQFVDTPQKRFLYDWGRRDGYQDGYAAALAEAKAQPAAQEPDELLREWIEAIGVNPELNRWHVSREDVLQLIRAARSKP